MLNGEVPVITYFPIRGRAEPIRLIFEELEVKYHDEVVEYQQWPQLKNKMPFGQLPLYREGDFTIADSHAIIRYLARKYDLYGAKEHHKVECEVIDEALHDAMTDIGNLIWDKDFDRKRQEFVENDLLTSLTNLDRYIGSLTRKDSCWVGDRITYVDFIGWSYLDLVRALTDRLLENYPRLLCVKSAFEQRPRIKSYLKSAKRPPTFTAPMASFGGTPETS